MLYFAFSFWFVGSFVISVRVRLSDGVSPSQGRVEVFDEGEWKSMCSLGWRNSEATVVCRMLGFPPATGVTSKSAFGAGGLPIWLHEFSCNGTERQLTECAMDTIFSYDDLWFYCDDGKEAGVVCGSPNGT